jgi:hypothetical protein|tara:strand:- start:1218 stop:1661 length:444 start_codon:yes stop_codon:yes gene_type:complete
MGILKGLSKVFSGKDKTEANDDSELPSFAENLKLEVDGERIAESSDGLLYVNYQELGGFEFMNLMIFSRINIRTKSHCKILFSGSSNLELTSDEEEIESDNSNPAKIWITTMSFDISKDQTKYISSKVADKITLSYKKKTLVFKTVK